MALLIAQALFSLRVASGQSSTTLDVRPATTDEMLTEWWKLATSAVPSPNQPTFFG